jgi:uncharacterized membrane protein
MSHLIVLTFDNVEEAGRVRKTLHDVQDRGYLSLDDSAVVVKDEDGKVHVKDEMDRGVKVGAVGGGVLGLLIGSVIFPLAGVVVGALGGALVGSLADLGIQKSFVKEVSEALEPGNSALFLVVREANPNVALAALKPYAGKIYHTSLPTETEESLREILSKRK